MRSNRFSEAVASLDPVRRSSWNAPHQRRTSFNVGKLIPIDNIPILPGDTVKMNLGSYVRATYPFVAAPMDDLILSTFVFFTPMRLVYDKTKEFFGENTSGTWKQSQTYRLPHITLKGNESFDEGSVGDYFGLPIKALNGSSFAARSYNALPMRAYGLIWNNYFRDQNVDNPCQVDTDALDRTYKKISDGYIAGSTRGGALLPVSRFHDQFSSCLPGTQKGPDVLLYDFADPSLGSGQAALPVIPFYGDFLDEFLSENGAIVAKNVGHQWNIYHPSEAERLMVGTDGGIHDGASGVSGTAPMAFANLGVDSSRFVVQSINDLRTAFQIQKIYERNARCGSRYYEYLKAAFGVLSPDASLQVPEFICGNEVYLNITPVPQTSASDESSETPQPLGRIAGYSATASNTGRFVKSFTEHGYLQVYACLRYKCNYSQGVDRDWLKRDKFEIYDPMLANIGEQPVYTEEIFDDGSISICGSGTESVSDKQVFGFQEAWYEYRYQPSRCTGKMRTDATDNLSMWHFGDYYAEAPTLSGSWLHMSASPLDRCLSVDSSHADAFIAQFDFDMQMTRVMPVYSIPGLIDHH